MQDKKLTIYALQHNVTGRIYVGRSKDPDKRIRVHISHLKHGKHSNLLMQKDCDEYGCDFAFFRLEEVDSYAKRDAELKWMLELKTYDPEVGYNSNDQYFRKKDKHVYIEYTDGIPKPNK